MFEPNEDKLSGSFKITSTDILKVSSRDGHILIMCVCVCVHTEVNA